MSKARLFRFSFCGFLSALLLFGFALGGQSAGLLTPGGSAATSVQELFGSEHSGTMVRIDGAVERVLPVVPEAKHQRFVVRLDMGQTLLVEHDLEVAAAAPLRHGDEVLLYGLFQWNPEGGLLRRTHHDPAGRHEDGWIEHAGERYE